MKIGVPGPLAAGGTDDHADGDGRAGLGGGRGVHGIDGDLVIDGVREGDNIHADLAATGDGAREGAGGGFGASLGLHAV